MTKTERIVAMFRRGLSPAAIARRLQIPCEHVHKALARDGIRAKN